jgi:hypothetical protein
MLLDENENDMMKFQGKKKNHLLKEIFQRTHVKQEGRKK